MSTFFRNLPSLNELLDAPPLKQLIETANRQTVVVSAKKFLSGLEAEVRSATASVPVPNVRELASQIARWISEGQPPRPSPIINASGDILHPSLSSPPIAKEAIAAMQIASAGYMQRAGQSGKAGDAAAIEALLCELTGAESAMVTNRGSSALLLALHAFSARGKIVVARGDLAESPRGERISDIASAANAVLQEVGAANRTTLSDYEMGLQGGAGSLLFVRWANTDAPQPLGELADLARRKGLPLIVELGGAPLIELKQFGVNTPTIREAVNSHAELVTFTTDSLIGGPACGVIVGKRQFVDALRSKSIFSCTAPNEIILAGLLATLELYKEPSKALEVIPTLSLLSTSLANLEFRAQRIAAQLKGSSILESVETAQDSSGLAGASTTSQVIPTHCVKILPKSAIRDSLPAKLLEGQPGVLTRSCKEYLCIDLRSVFPDQDAKIVEAMEALSAIDKQ